MILIHDIPLGYIILLLKPGKITCQSCFYSNIIHKGR